MHVAAERKPTGKERYLQNPGLISVEEAARQKGVSARAVYKRIAEGNLPVMLVGKLKLVHEKDVETWQVNAHRQELSRLGGRPRRSSEEVEN